MITDKAYAKINLFLEVKSRRKDGYHNIESIFQKISLFDTLTFKKSHSGIKLFCSDKSLPTNSRNLVVKAANLLRSKYPEVKCGARIKLEKRIPSGAGLGGGSSDAACTLKNLVKLWNINISDTKLHKLAVKLGADVPFFLKGQTAHVSGIGDKIRLINGVRRSHYLLLNPGVSISTAWVYKNLHFPLTKKQKINRIKELLKTGLFNGKKQGVLYNRLEEVVFKKYTEVRRIREVLGELGYQGLMSGSGSSVFALVKNEEHGRKLAKKLKKFPWNARLVKSIP